MTDLPVSKNDESQPLPRSLNRQVVLEEDEYTKALSHIIARDFFPSLVHLDATNNYLDALRSEDPQLINASVRQLRDLATPSTSRNIPLQTPSQTPWATGPSDTPIRPSDESERPFKKPRYAVDMSLDSFQARYTSEDNSSFTQILDEENQKRRERYGWAWDAQKRVEAQRDKMIAARERMLIEPSSAPGIREKLVIEAPKPAGLITQGEMNVESQKAQERPNERGEPQGNEAQNDDVDANKQVAIVNNLVHETEEKVDVMARKKDTRSAGVDGWEFKVSDYLLPIKS